MKQFSSHGTGEIDVSKFRALGTNVVFERGSMVFHPEQIELGDNIYVGHYAILKGYYKNLMKIGDNVWIGQQAFLHSAGGLEIGNNVGIGPGVSITTSNHGDPAGGESRLAAALVMKPVIVEDDCNIGVGAIILPGVRIGRGARIGAGAVVTSDVGPGEVVAGVPARVLR
jgi:acetyltransferase-like isoleucine patch superfamily enzyme